ncbi:MAG: acyl-CoA dehydrogenase [Anaerolineae bacterium]|nr:acyl-CoA dehydrogenase [Anaerolineae bacterium]NIN99397.1 acyl-CoA dehydrogenase [Anaerolineae bacterium]NIQ82262.1 acyl-CoA dehydrogenase [Anaerolineae bacterium]
MDFALTDEQRMIQELARDFATEVLAPAAPIIDQTEEYPFDNCRRMGELGLMGIEIPYEDGGTGADTVSYVVALEEVSKACGATGTIMSVNNSLVCHGLVMHGTPEQRERYLRPAASFERIGTFSLSEPQAGSDAASQRTKAVRDGKYYVVNGAKNFISSGGVADFHVVFCVTDPDATPKHHGISCLLIDADTPGFTAGKPEEKLGIRAANTTALSFEDCRVPISSRLGDEGEGFNIAMEVLDAGRIGIAAQALGIGQAALEASSQYALEREQFGKPLARHQAIQFMIADMATRLEAARLLTFRAALKKQHKERYSLEASMAKVYASETAVWAANKAVQIHGGYGYIREYNVERYYRDAKITDIYEGTSEVQRMIIARHFLRD